MLCCFCMHDYTLIVYGTCCALSLCNFVNYHNINYNMTQKVFWLLIHAAIIKASRITQDLKDTFIFMIHDQLRALLKYKLLYVYIDIMYNACVHIMYTLYIYVRYTVKLNLISREYTGNNIYTVNQVKLVSTYMYIDVKLMFNHTHE